MSSSTGDEQISYEDAMKNLPPQEGFLRLGPKDSTDYGWSGPSAASSLRERKNDKLYESALNRLESKVEIPGLEMASGSDRSHQIATRKIKPFDNDFFTRAGHTEDAYHQGCTDLMSGRTEDGRKAFEQVEIIASSLIQDILQKLRDLRIHNLGFIPGYLPAIYTDRAMSRLNLGNHQGAVDDATEGIRLWKIRENMQGQSAIVLLLMTRGRASRNLGLLEEALADFRGCGALIRGLPGWERQPSIGEVTGEILRTLVMIKIHDKATRPHYTEAERKRWMKELGIGEFSLDSYTCGNCGVTRADPTVKLSRCSGCQKKWYCSKACLTQAWKQKGHKAECKELRENDLLAMDASMIEQMKQQIEKEGYVQLSGNRFWMQDSEKGSFFDSLMDKDYLVGGTIAD